ncbi:hypothetical protein IFM89_015113 [Coptis chinensis]|uniref:Uncharacterized protein n=1 Tax=Coptis chinensis TaxID=261450 RepID=A0A835M904_9MAGN|nr:hypothetical protein IFM89_015113 [Coptis chinensis]
MSLIFSTQPSTTTFSNFHPNSSIPKTTLTNPKKFPFPFLPLQMTKFPKLLNFKCNVNPNNPNTSEPPKIAFNYDFEEETNDNSPWEGAIVYKRNATVTHLEYCTTLERLGLGKLSTQVSKSRASTMGLRVTKGVKEFKMGTPVLVSVDVCRKKGKLRLDGIVKTVLSLGCNRCGEPAAECVFSNFTLLLTEEAIEEGDVINMGVIFGESKKNTYNGTGEDEDEDDDVLIDLDDRLYFPAEVNEIDISKNIRDMVHVEITINAVCNSKCKGLCLRCGVNLNTSKCRCRKQEDDKNVGPLGNLRKEMQKK